MPVRARGSDFTGPQIAVLFIVLALLTSIPVWTHPLPPLSDYVNHLARMYVIATMGKNPDLARYYAVDWQIIPNLMMDMIVPIIGRFMNIYHAGQVFIVATFVLIISGTLALNRALIGRWSVAPLIAFPLLYNYVFLVGLMNYLFGIGLAIWALAIWIRLRDWPWLVGILVSTLFVVALFFCHLFALGIYGVGVLSFELLQIWQSPKTLRSRRLIYLFGAGLPFLAAIPLLLKSPTLGLVADYNWEPRGKIDGLMFVISVYSDIAAFSLIGIIVAAAAWAIRHRQLRFHPMIWALLAVSGVIYLALPRVLFASYMADQRMPIAIAFMLVACVDLELRHRLVRRGFLAVLLLVLAGRLLEVNIAWSDLSSTTTEFRASVRRIKQGSKVFVAYSDRSLGDDVRDLGLVHAACIAMIDRSALVTTAFTVVGKQIMHVRPEYHDYVDTEDGTPPSIAQLVIAADRPAPDMPAYWRSWPERFDYLYILFTEDDAPNPDPAHLTLIDDGDRFQLYRVNKPGAPPSSNGARSR